MTIRDLATLFVGALIGALVGWLGGVLGASAAMRETLIERDNYRDTVRNQIKGARSRPDRVTDKDLQQAGARAFHAIVTGDTGSDG